MRGGVLQLARWGLLDAVFRGHAGRSGEHLPLRRRRVSADHPQAVVRRAGPVRPAAHGARPDPGRRGRGRRCRRALRRHRDRRRARPPRPVTGITGRAGWARRCGPAARIVVGADGISSTIAERCRCAVERLGTSVASVTYGYWTASTSDGYEWYFRPDAASGVFPTNDGQTCVFASASPRRIGRGGRDRCTHRRRYAARPRRHGSTPPTPPRRDAHLHRQARLPPPGLGPGWALVGDAGYFKDPISAHGLTDALRDAELLARAVVAVVRDGADERDALAGYQATRDALSAALFDVTDVIAGHRWTDARSPSCCSGSAQRWLTSSRLLPPCRRFRTSSGCPAECPHEGERVFARARW